MRFTLHRYVLAELLPPFLLGLVALTFILVMPRVLLLTDLVVTRGVGLVPILRLLGYVILPFLVLTIPMTCLLAICTGLSRLAADREIIAFKASGVSLYRLLPPVALFTGALLLLTIYLSVVVQPWAHASMRQLVFDLAQGQTQAAVRERVFIRDFEGFVLYIQRVRQPEQELEGILIADTRRPDIPYTIVARRGLVVSDLASQTLTLRLFEGSLHRIGEDLASYSHAEFTTYDLQLGLTPALMTARAEDRRDQELTRAELEVRMRSPIPHRAIRARFELERRYALPFACLAFATLAVPLGAALGRPGRSAPTLLSLGVVFLYYVLYAVGEKFVERGGLDPAPALWAPNVLLTALGVVLLVRAAREAPVLPGGLSWLRPARDGRAAVARGG